MLMIEISAGSMDLWYLGTCLLNNAWSIEANISFAMGYLPLRCGDVDVWTCKLGYYKFYLSTSTEISMFVFIACKERPVWLMILSNVLSISATVDRFIYVFLKGRRNSKSGHDVLVRV